MPAENPDDGFRRIRVATEPDATRLLQRAAARRALADAQLGPEDLDGLIVLRNGLFPAHEAVWLSAVHGHDLGLRSGAMYLDLKSPACAGFALGVSMASSFIRSEKPSARLLVVGGGAAGYRRRWFANPPKQAGGPSSGTGLLLGDGAFSFIVGPGGGRFDILACETFIDAEFADTQSLDGLDYVATDEVMRTWLFTRCSGPASRVVVAALSRARLDPKLPAFFVGTNSGRTIKTEYCKQVSINFREARFLSALEVQLGALAEHGHLFGGDVIANLSSLCEKDLLRSGDAIICVEAGDTYFYSAAVLRRA